MMPIGSRHDSAAGGSSLAVFRRGGAKSKEIAGVQTVTLKMKKTKALSRGSSYFGEITKSDGTYPIGRLTTYLSNSAELTGICRSTDAISKQHDIDHCYYDHTRNRCFCLLFSRLPREDQGGLSSHSPN